MKINSRRIVAILIAMILLLLFAGRCIWASQSVGKKAVRKNELDGTYILCERVQVTGFQWLVVSGSESGNQSEYCNISGANPFEEYKFTYDFLIAENTYVFYVEERKEYYSEVLGEMVVEYVASDWDILYPVRHGTLLERFQSPDYIIKGDLDSRKNRH